MGSPYDPHNLRHYCGGPVKTTEFEGRWSAVCQGCGATSTGDHKTAEELMLSWYGIKPEKECAADVEDGLVRLIAYLVEHDEEVYSRELIAVGGEGARRALDILDKTGLVRSRFEIEEGSRDASVEEATEAKKNGRTVKVFCRRNFNLLASE